MTAEKAFKLYEKLKPFLRAIPPWDFYLPPKRPGDKTNWSLRGEHWPLRHQPGYPCRPLAVTWNPKRKDGRPITFWEFLTVYKITLHEAEA